MTRRERELANQTIGLPQRPFLYTLDQIATLLAKDLDSLKVNYVYYEGRSIGLHRKDRLRAANIAPVGQRPDWRVAEEELLRWLKRTGVRFY